MRRKLHRQNIRCESRLACKSILVVLDASRTGSSAIHIQVFDNTWPAIRTSGSVCRASFDSGVDPPIRVPQDASCSTFRDCSRNRGTFLVARNGSLSAVPPDFSWMFGFDLCASDGRWQDSSHGVSQFTMLELNMSAKPSKPVSAPAGFAVICFRFFLRTRFDSTLLLVRRLAIIIKLTLMCHCRCFTHRRRPSRHKRTSSRLLT